MPRRKTRRSKGQGTIIKRKDRGNKLVAIVRYTDEAGKKHVIKQYVSSKTEGDLFIKKKMAEIGQHGTSIIDGDRLTLTDLAKIYKDKRLVEPIYKGDTKIAGLRSYKEQQTYLKTLVEHFGASRVRFITHSDVEQYKAERMQTKTRHHKERSVAHVNRDFGAN